MSYLGEEVRPFSFSTLRPLQLSSVNSTFGWNPSDLEPRASLKRDIELLDMGNKLTSLKFLFLLGQYEYFNIMTHSANVLIALLILVRADDDDDDTGDEGVASNYDQVQHAHGFTMGLSFAILFPLGAALIRLLRFRQVAWLHGAWQIFTYTLVIAGFGMGVWMAMASNGGVDQVYFCLFSPTASITNNLQWSAFNGHTIIGTIVFCLLTLQPFGGIIHHNFYRTNPTSTIYGVSHRWMGRIILILGAINGGLGLQLAAEENPPIIAYSVLTAFFFLLWLAAVVWNNLSGESAGEAGTGGVGEKSQEP